MPEAVYLKKKKLAARLDNEEQVCIYNLFAQTTGAGDQGEALWTRVHRWAIVQAHRCVGFKDTLETVTH